MNTFSAKLYLFWSFVICIFVSYNAPTTTGITKLFTFEMLIITLTLNAIVTQNIGRAGGWLKENLFNTWH